MKVEIKIDKVNETEIHIICDSMKNRDKLHKALKNAINMLMKMP